MEAGRENVITMLIESIIPAVTVPALALSCKFANLQWWKQLCSGSTRGDGGGGWGGGAV